MDILEHRNYRKYAIQRPKTINQIVKINNWARELTFKKIFKKC